MVDTIDPKVRRILFISHEATLSGAPLALLYIISSLAKSKRYNLSLLLMNDGPLAAEFEKICKVIHVGRRKRLLRFCAMHPYPDLVYSNTIAGGELLPKLAPFMCPVITHVHEQEYAFTILSRHFECAKQYTNRYIAVSSKVKSNLVQQHGISDSLVDIVHPILKPLTISGSIKDTRMKVCSELGIPNDSFIVGNVGSGDLRKGPDLFIQLASLVNRQMQGNPVHFIWVGPEPEELTYLALIEDIRKLKLSNLVHFVGRKSDPSNYYAAFDLFALTSREDPYPAVCLEAASIGIPIVCFDESGGIPEMVTSGCGVSVPYLDIQEMANKIGDLLQDKPKRVRMGQAGCDIVKHYHIDEIMPQIEKIIESML